MRVECGACGHEWNYTGRWDPTDPSNYIQCPKCRKSDVSPVEEAA